MSPGAGKWHNDAIHEEVNDDAIQRTRKHGVLNEEAHSAADRKEHTSCRECDREMAEQTEKRGRESAGKGSWPQQSAGDALQHTDRRNSQEAIHNCGGRNVHDAARESRPDDGPSGLELRAGDGCCGIHRYCAMSRASLHMLSALYCN